MHGYRERMRKLISPESAADHPLEQGFLREHAGWPRAAFTKRFGRPSSSCSLLLRRHNILPAYPRTASTSDVWMNAREMLFSEGMDLPKVYWPGMLQRRARMLRTQTQSGRDLQSSH